MGWDKNNLLETAMTQEKQTWTETRWITKMYKRESDSDVKCALKSPI